MRITCRRFAVVRPGFLQGLIILSIITAISIGFAAAAEVIGPGVAGQVKALAYDPDSVVDGVCKTIYAGGDVSGVYVSEDDGLSWQRWNKGLEDPGVTKSYYIDDLLVI